MDNPDGVRGLEQDLGRLFGDRLLSLVVYGRRSHSSHAGAHHDAHTHEERLTHTLAIINKLSIADLRACAPLVTAWHEAHLATPLLIAAQEFDRSLDAFPFEFGAILADHQVIVGTNPFEGLHVDPADLRRACEIQARGHLLHLREGFLETLGRGDRLSVLITDSVPAFAALVVNLARLDNVTASDVATAARHLEQRLQVHSTGAVDIVSLVGLREIDSRTAERLFPPYLDAVERLVTYLDEWKG